MKRFLIQTLGCKVNQCESAALTHSLETSGYSHASREAAADLVVINTCTVTGRAAMQSRQAVRQAVRKHPGARIVVTGCFAQTAADELKAISGVDLIVGHSHKHAIPDLLSRIAAHGGTRMVHEDIAGTRLFAPLPWAAPEGRTRAFLKIQDGCNAMCTYCIVPYARGRSRSMPVDQVLDHIERLGNSGFREVVLTGIHLGAYGADLSPPLSLSEVLDRILMASPVNRIRLSSIEPTEVNASLFDCITRWKKRICPHWHIPMQSGSDAILERMGRPYRQEDYARVVRTIQAANPHAAIGADVMVGFPGEDEAAFDQTYTLIEHLPLNYLHVFPFSPRKGTPAARFKGRPPDRVVKARCNRLRRLGEEKRKQFYETLIGTTVQVLIENGTDSKTGQARGFSENYVPVSISAARLRSNMLVRARIESVMSDRMVLASLISLTDPMKE